MTEQVKIVAEFEDKASAGIKKVNDAVNELSNKGGSSGSGLSGLGEAVQNLGQHFQGLAAGGTDALGSIRSLAGGAAEATASMGGFGAGAATAVGAVVGIAAAAAAAYAGMELISAGARDAADGAAEMADKLGVSMERLEVLKVIADENAGSVEGLQRVFDKLSRQMQKLDDDSDLAEYAFASLGLEMKDLAGKSEQEIAGIVIKNWEDLGRSTKATAAVQQLLGGSFRDQIPAIKEMSSKMADYEKRVKEFSSTATDDIVEAGGRQEQATTNLGLAWKGLANEISRWTGEMMTSIKNWAADALKNIKDVLGELRRGLDEGAKIRALPEATRKKLFKQAVDESKAAGKGDSYDILDRYNALARAEINKKTPEQIAAEQAKAAADAAEEKRKAELKEKSDKAEKPNSKKDPKEKKDEYKEALVDLERQLAVTKDTSNEEKVLFETQKGRFKNFSASQKEQLIGIAKQIDLRNAETKKQEELTKLQEEAAKQIKAKQEREAETIALQEYEVSLAGMTAEERKKLMDIKKQELDFARETKNLSEAELKAAKERADDLEKRREVLRATAKEAATINTIMDQSKARIQESVTENLMVAAKLLESGKITVDDYTKYQNTQLERLGMKVEEVTDNWTIFWEEAAKNTQGIMADFFFDFMRGKMSSLGDAFKTMLDRMVAQALAAQLGEALFGSTFGQKGGQLGGWVGQAAGWLGSFFGGGRATGGDVTPGKMYMVGENGPEPFIPKVAGTILPNSTMKSMTTAAATNINISAVDAQSFRSMLERDPRFVADLVHKTTRAYNMGNY